MFSWYYLVDPTGRDETEDFSDRIFSAISYYNRGDTLFFQLDRENKIGGLIPRVTFEDKSTYTESDTKKYDQVSAKMGEK